MSSKQYFDDVASQWDEMRQSFFSEAVRDKAMSVAQVESGKLAADIGAGSGFVVEGLIRAGVRVIAVDRSEAMLDEMRGKFSHSDEVEYRVGDASRLPMADAEVDYVFANMYLHHVQTPPEAIEEMVRVLRPGGGLVITDLDEHTFEFLRTEQHDRWLGFQRQDVHRWFEEAGLLNVMTDGVGESCCAQSSQGDAGASVTIFVAYGRRALAQHRSGDGQVEPS